MCGDLCRSCGGEKSAFSHKHSEHVRVPLVCCKVTFIFELMDMSLYDYLKSRRRGLTERKAKEYLYQLLRGLEHLHRNGLFHRDVKPENVLVKFPSLERSRLTKIQTYDIVKLADLGSVRGIYSVPPYTEYISTRWYRSPECLLTNGNYGPKMDVWATGCVFYEMITLSPLFPGSSEIDQLAKIHQILGSPSVQFLNKLKSKSRNCVYFPKVRGSGVDQILPHVTRNGKEILQYTIEYDPDKRSNVRRLLKNAYFDEIRGLFEPVMEGTQQRKHKSHCRSLERVERGLGDNVSSVSAGKPKVFRREPSQISKTNSSKSSAASLKSVRSRTPSIEIPYYTPSSKSQVKQQRLPSLPLVDFKIFKDDKGPTSSSSSKSKMSSRGHSKKNLEIILKSSRERKSQLSSKSEVVARKRGHNGGTDQHCACSGKKYK
ncbi:MAPK/MAK/MRK overlapping kinase-like isoform X2 [Cylas formicarius]|uniref:MAPK/MAK/MRK overlapping kinase-like isoform X2 n=1 Tax=Cylas formicarius TaxID=197179 RepID=UPI002958D6E7|nr:MAPK/MAK/MRK overlapping kinase-like isoform X2 [Cylas formicarius]